MSDGLLPQPALLAASAISDEVAMARGYRSVEQRARLTELGFSSTQARVPALLIPIWNVQGEIALYQTRADDPRIVGGKAVKYEIPAGSRMVLDVPPPCRNDLGNPRIPHELDRRPDPRGSWQPRARHLLRLRRARGRRSGPGPMIAAPTARQTDRMIATGRWSR